MLSRQEKRVSLKIRLNVYKSCFPGFITTVLLLVVSTGKASEMIHVPADDSS